MEKTEFNEEANDYIKKECKQFIEEHKDIKNNYMVYSNAIKLTSKLIESLIESHKEFDEAIDREWEIYQKKDSDVSKYLFAEYFNNKGYKLYLDAEAHKLLQNLETIENNNKN